MCVCDVFVMCVWVYAHSRSSSKLLTEQSGEFGSFCCTSTSCVLSTSLVRNTLVRRDASATDVSLSVRSMNNKWAWSKGCGYLQPRDQPYQQVVCLLFEEIRSSVWECKCLKMALASAYLTFFLSCLCSCSSIAFIQSTSSAIVSSSLLWLMNKISIAERLTRLDQTRMNHESTMQLMVVMLKSNQ